jgi:hypothetical protein
MRCKITDNVTSATIICPAYTACPLNRLIGKTILVRHFNCNRRELKNHGTVSLDYTEFEAYVRSEISKGLICPQCGCRMNINEGQSLIESDTYSVEHIKSLFTGGSNLLTNIKLVCRKCNYENEKKYAAEIAGE